MSGRLQGFTLIELLIAIVVIAILAAISVVSYNGIQERAHDTRAAAAASTYAKVIKMYRADGGTLSSGTSSCLGDLSQYPASGNFMAGECYVETMNGVRASSGYRVGRIAAFADQIDTYLTRKPEVNFPVVQFRYNNGVGYDTRGVFYNGYNSVVYILKGNKDCIDPSYIAEINATYCYAPVKLTGDTL